MTEHRHRSTFLGPQHAFYQPADWPAPCNYHLRLYDMLPGDHWRQDFWNILIQPHLLEPTGQWNHWRKLGPPFCFQYKQQPDDIRILVEQYSPYNRFFYIRIRLGIATFAYNTILEPHGMFAYGGSATLAREDT